MIRRKFLRTMAGGAAMGVLARGRSAAWGAEEAAGKVMTVEGPIDAAQMGVTLPHEHVLVDFIGADKASRDRYDRDEAFRVALPHLKRARELGVRTLVECTPAYLGRDPVLLRRLAKASGVRLVTNTGYYGAGQGKFVPRHAHVETAQQLAARWIAEWRDGIEGADVRPGFIKTAVNNAPLSQIDRKLVHAAARTHQATGLAIASHTGKGAAALAELEILKAEGVDPLAFIWVHAQNERDESLHARVAKSGAWLEFDGIGPKSLERHLACVRAMKERELLGRVMISHDAGWYHVGEPGGGNFRPFDLMFTKFIPSLKKAGLTEAEIRRLTVDNPREAFAIRVRAKA